MSDLAVDPERAAAEIIAAHSEHRLLDAISAGSLLTLDDAYEIQRHITGFRLARGERRVGWKLGYTSLAMRQQMGVDTPNFGPLTNAMQIDNGALVHATATQPRVEPEVALVLGSAVGAGADRDAVMAAVASAHACLEVVDSVWRDYKFRIEDNTADGSSACGFVLGDEMALDSIVEVEVVLTLDGEEVGRGHGSDAGGHPADGVVWLVEQLAARGERLEPGDVLLTGGLTRAVAIEPGSRVAAASASRQGCPSFDRRLVSDTSRPRDQMWSRRISGRDVSDTKRRTPNPHRVNISCVRVRRTRSMYRARRDRCHRPLPAQPVDDG